MVGHLSYENLCAPLFLTGGRFFKKTFLHLMFSKRLKLILTIVLIAAVCCLLAVSISLGLYQRPSVSTFCEDAGSVELADADGSTELTSAEQFMRLSNHTLAIKCLVLCLDLDANEPFDDGSGHVFFVSSRHALHFDFAHQVLGVVDDRLKVRENVEKLEKCENQRGGVAVAAAARACSSVTNIRPFFCYV